jgi:hypothetical protein
VDQRDLERENTGAARTHARIRPYTHPLSLPDAQAGKTWHLLWLHTRPPPSVLGASASAAASIRRRRMATPRRASNLAAPRQRQRLRLLLWLRLRLRPVSHAQMACHLSRLHFFNVLRLLLHCLSELVIVSLLCASAGGGVAAATAALLHRCAPHVMQQRVDQRPRAQSTRWVHLCRHRRRCRSGGISRARRSRVTSDTHAVLVALHALAQTHRHACWLFQHNQLFILVVHMQGDILGVHQLPPIPSAVVPINAVVPADLVFGPELC